MKEKVLNALIYWIFTDSFENPLQEICLSCSRSYFTITAKYQSAEFGYLWPSMVVMPVLQILVPPRFWWKHTFSLSYSIPLHSKWFFSWYLCCSTPNSYASQLFFLLDWWSAWAAVDSPEAPYTLSQSLIFCALSSFFAIPELARRYSTWEAYVQESCTPKAKGKGRRYILQVERVFCARSCTDTVSDVICKRNVCCLQPSTTITLQNWKQSSSVQA